jgi:hypothetical protein
MSGLQMTQDELGVTSPTHPLSGGRLLALLGAGVAITAGLFALIHGHPAIHPRALRLGAASGSLAMVLATGIYSIAVAWGLAGWIVMSLASLLAIAAVGAFFTGMPMARIEADLKRTTGVLPEGLRRQLRSRVLTTSMTTRVGITLGVLLLMVCKPDPVLSVVAVGAAAAIGIATGLALGGRSATLAPSSR